MDVSDCELIGQIRAGSSQATAELVRRHWGRCHRLAALLLDDQAAAEDVAQEAMLNALRALDRFEAARPFEPWLHRIVVNRARDHLRARARRHEVRLEPAEHELAGAEPELPDLSATELLIEIRRLRPQYRLIVVARFVLDYEPAEIAELLAIPGPTVRTQLRRALTELRESIQREEVPNERAL